jgi:predicted GH43/DUF377 family glycosyl hydrolase
MLFPSAEKDAEMRKHKTDILLEVSKTLKHGGEHRFDLRGLNVTTLALTNDKRTAGLSPKKIKSSYSIVQKRVLT